MLCPQCQHENPDAAQFCNACGTKLEAACPACGHVNPPGSRFCNTCGHNLLTPAPTSAESPQRPGKAQERELLTYTPQHLAEKILTSRSAMEGERKQVTVMFADIKDSTDLIRDLDPEAAQRLLDPLPPESADEFLEALLGNDPSLKSLKKLLIERTEGNPFLLEESAQTLVETQVLVGEQGAYQLVQELPTIPVPPTVICIPAAVRL